MIDFSVIGADEMISAQRPKWSALAGTVWYVNAGRIVARRCPRELADRINLLM